MSQGNEVEGKAAVPAQSGTAQRPLEIVIDGVSKSYSENFSALESINLTIRPGERLVVLGPSGSGKSTLLRIIAGLEAVSSGRLLIGGKDQTNVPPHRRDASMIFQNPALFPHLSVFENLAFGLRARERGERVECRVVEVAEMLGLAKLLDRPPAALSGGERQRVAIGRAIAWRPRILLLDEPFSSLDAPLRASLRDDLLAMHRRLCMTLIHVTHDQGEALAVGDRVAVLDAGRLLQCDTPVGLYERPSHRSIAEFIGNPPMNVIPCELVREASTIRVSLAMADGVPLGSLEGPDHPLFSTMKEGVRQRLDLGIRPEHIVFATMSPPNPAARLALTVNWRLERVEFQGHESWLRVSLHGAIVKLRVSGQSRAEVGQTISVSFQLTEASWFDPIRGLAVGATENPFAEAKRAC